ncbi:MAG: hypothetical protein UZ02_AOB001002585, partial [Nitrosomonas europaea]
EQREGKGQYAQRSLDFVNIDGPLSFLLRICTVHEALSLFIGC